MKNEEFELHPRKVEIEELILKEWDQANGILKIKVSCTSGTYIRSIARDLGQVLDSEGCLLNLRRISACGFHEKNSIKISDLSDLKNKKAPFIIPTISALDHISTLVLANQEEINFWQTGRIIKFDANNFVKSRSFDYKKPIKIIDNNKILLGIGFINEEKTTLHPKLVLNAK
jgi:tRNA pseudouridine55 synthase